MRKDISSFDQFRVSTKNCGLWPEDNEGVFIFTKPEDNTLLVISSRRPVDRKLPAEWEVLFVSMKVYQKGEWVEVEPTSRPMDVSMVIALFFEKEEIPRLKMVHGTPGYDHTLQIWREVKPEGDGKVPPVSAPWEAGNN